MAERDRLQHKMKSTREKWAGQKYDFYLIAHEHYACSGSRLASRSAN